MHRQHQRCGNCQNQRRVLLGHRRCLDMPRGGGADRGLNQHRVSCPIPPPSWALKSSAPPPPPPCDMPSGCCSFTGPWTVTRSSLRMLRRVAAFCRPLRPVLSLVSFPPSRSPVVGVPGLCGMWRDVPFARQRRPIVGVLRMCWLSPPPPPSAASHHSTSHRVHHDHSPVRVTADPRHHVRIVLRSGRRAVPGPWPCAQEQQKSRVRGRRGCPATRRRGNVPYAQMGGRATRREGGGATPRAYVPKPRDALCPARGVAGSERTPPESTSGSKRKQFCASRMLLRPFKNRPTGMRSSNGTHAQHTLGHPGPHTRARTNRHARARTHKQARARAHARMHTQTHTRELQ